MIALALAAVALAAIAAAVLTARVVSAAGTRHAELLAAAYADAAQRVSDAHADVADKVTAAAGVQQASRKLIADALAAREQSAEGERKRWHRSETEIDAAWQADTEATGGLVGVLAQMVPAGTEVVGVDHDGPRI